MWQISAGKNIKLVLNLRTFSISLSTTGKLAICATWRWRLLFCAIITYTAFWVISDTHFPTNATVRTAFPLDSFAFKLQSRDGKSITWLYSVVIGSKILHPSIAQSCQCMAFQWLRHLTGRALFQLTGWWIVIWSLRHHTTVLGIDADLLRGDILSCYGGWDSRLPKREWVMWCHTHILEANLKSLLFRVFYPNLTRKSPYDVTVLQTDDVTQPKSRLLRKSRCPNSLFSSFFYTAEKGHMTLGDLASGASYMFEVYARNERGRGRFANSLVVDTLASS